MAKAKSFAEKMLKSLKEEQKFTTLKVIRPVKNSKGAMRWDTRILKIGKNDNENELLGL